MFGSSLNVISINYWPGSLLRTVLLTSLHALTSVCAILILWHFLYLLFIVSVARRKNFPQISIFTSHSCMIGGISCSSIWNQNQWQWQYNNICASLTSLLWKYCLTFCRGSEAFYHFAAKDLYSFNASYFFIDGHSCNSVCLIKTIWRILLTYEKMKGFLPKTETCKTFLCDSFWTSVTVPPSMRVRSLSTIVLFMRFHLTCLIFACLINVLFGSIVVEQ